MEKFGNVVPLFQPDNYKWVHRRIKHLWSEGNVIPLAHAQKRMQERDLQITDVQSILRYGKIVEHSQPMELWRYKILGAALDGRRSTVIVEVDAHSLIIVTVTGKKRKQ